MPTTSYTQEENLRLAGLQHRSNLAALAAAAQANMGIANAGAGLCGGLLGGDLGRFRGSLEFTCQNHERKDTQSVLDRDYDKYMSDIKRMMDNE